MFLTKTNKKRYGRCDDYGYCSSVGEIRLIVVCDSKPHRIARADKYNCETYFSDNTRAIKSKTTCESKGV